MDPDPIQAALGLSRRAPFVHVSTLHEGCPDARLMFNLRAMRAGAWPRELGFGTWLGTNTSSRKVGDLRADPRICLYYADPETFEGLSLQGTVVEETDEEVREALWMEGWEAYYPGGRDGGDFTLLRFEPLRGRYYHGLRVVDFDAAPQCATEAL